MLHSISDLTTFCRKTTGDVPAKLVGASTTVVGSKMYLFGGRLVTERRMVSDLYVFDLETFKWEKVPPHHDDDVPRARYFHSADAWNNQLIIFGGMSNRFDSPNPDDLCVLNDVRFFDISTRRWLPSSLSNGVVSDPVSDTLVPRARYAHLSSVTASRLFIIGGQDFFNVWLDDVCVYDLVSRTWIRRRDYPRHCGTYRSVAVSSNLCVRLPQEELKAIQAPTTLGLPGTRFKADNMPQSSSEFTSSESITHLPYSAAPTEEHTCDIYLYSNYNFTDVKRELEVFSPLPDDDFTIQDRSSNMVGTSFPPGLRFPTGTILGTHLIIAGTYLAHTYQSFSIWALDLLNMTWTRIDPGSAVATGSWFRGCLWAETNKFLIFGNREGNLVDDYNRRLLSWDHVAVVDLEAFGIYQPPPLKLDIPMQELGLAALEERVLTDFEIVCDDGRKIACSRKLLEERWPWFKEQYKKFAQTAKQALQTLPSSPMHIGLPEVAGSTLTDDSRPDPRLTPRAFLLSEPYPITLAFLQYFYSLALLTPLQHAPAVLSQLLVLSSTYQITHLESLVKHAMHRALSNSTSVGVYEVATLCSCRSLQIRALKTVMSYSQKRPSRSRQDKDNSGNRPPGSSSGGGTSSRPATGGPGDSHFTARPRGTSDAHWRGQTEQGPSIGREYSLKNNPEETLLPCAQPTSITISPTLPAFSAWRSIPSRQERTMSVVSDVTDSEICALADFMLPTISHMTDNRSSQLQQHYTGLDDSPETIVEPYAEDSTDPQGDRNCLDAIPENFRIPVSSLSRGTSTYSDSSIDFDEISDAESTRYSRATNSTCIPFHLPTSRPKNLAPHFTDSDTPSLSSSASFSSLASTSRSQSYYGSPSTPCTLPVSPLSENNTVTKQLDIIEEQRLPESQEITYHLPGDTLGSPSAIRIIGPQTSMVTSWPKHKSNVEWKTPESTPNRRSSSSSHISNSVPASPIPSAPISPTSSTSTRFAGVSVPRLLSSAKGPAPHKSNKTPSIKSVKSQPDFSSVVSGFDPKMIKEEEKRRKKAEAKARVERLAYELKEKSKARSENEDKQSVHSVKSRSREQPAIFGGMIGVTM